MGGSTSQPSDPSPLPSAPSPPPSAPSPPPSAPSPPPQLATVTSPSVTTYTSYNVVPPPPSSVTITTFQTPVSSTPIYSTSVSLPAGNTTRVTLTISQEDTTASCSATSTSTSTVNVQPDEPILQCSRDSQICMPFLKGVCNNGLDCHFLHTDAPYLWAYWTETNKTWYKFADQKCLEKSFCNPLHYHCRVTINQNGYSSQLDITFNDDIKDSFSAQNFEISRFSTLSNGLNQDIMATQWLWYYEAVCIWEEYSKDTGCSLSSIDFEKAFLKPEKHITFSINADTFLVIFDSLKQINIDTQSSKKIRRRPKYLSSIGSDNPELKKTPCRQRKVYRGGRKRTLRKSKEATQFLEPFNNCPNQVSTGEDREYYLKPIPCTRINWEFRLVIKKMKLSMPNVFIKAVYRIVNKKICEQFILKRRQMMAKLTAENLNEQFLFHGCPAACINSICRQGFDCRMSGERVGTRYGRGAYFAVKASFADKFCEQNSKRCKKLFMAKVLAGRFIPGSPECIQPPAIANSLELYDSCVDVIDQPTTFVIFDPSQVYPEYLIQYR